MQKLTFKTPADRDAHIVRLYTVTKLSVREIVDAIGHGRYIIDRALREANVQMRKFTPEGLEAGMAKRKEFAAAQAVERALPWPEREWPRLDREDAFALAIARSGRNYGADDLQFRPNTGRLPPGIKGSGMSLTGSSAAFAAGY